MEERAKVLIDGDSQTLKAAQSNIIPPNSKNTITPNERLKMISTIIINEYDQKPS